MVQIITDIANYLVRPPRTNYKTEDLGPEIVQEGEYVFQRTDFEVFI